MSEDKKHTLSELRQMQALPLKLKIELTKDRIRGWLDQYDSYISFSGGKDSTVLLHIARQIDKSVPAVYIDTGLEYPELREFVKTFDNVTWVKPKMNFRQVIEKYGYPLISKEVAECVYGAKKYVRKLLEKQEGSAIISGGVQQTTQYRIGIDTINYLDSESMKNPTRGGETTSLESFVGSENIPKMLKQIYNTEELIDNFRVQRVLGILPKKGKATLENIPEPKDRSLFSCAKYAYLLDADFEVSHKCCDVMKKNPAHTYQRRTGRMPITGQMASESRLRTQQWLKNGCNGFNMKSPVSNPMSFWTEQDVLAYIKIFNIPICSIYGEVVREDGEPIESTDGWLEAGMLDLERPLLTTSGVLRSGCVFCGFGAHLEKEPNRFQKLKETHPALWNYCMKPWEEQGLGMKHVLGFIGVKTE